MNKWKLPKRWVPLLERRLKYDNFFDDREGFEFSSYDEACEEFENDARINNRTPENHFLAIRTIFEMQLDRINTTWEERKNLLIETLIKIYKEIN